MLNKGTIFVEAVSRSHILKHGLVRIFYMLQFASVIRQKPCLSHYHTFIDPVGPRHRR